MQGEGADDPRGPLHRDQGGHRQDGPRSPEQVGVVSLSSTLATNSIVEGKGARVALVCMGGDYESSYPADFRIRVAGAHDIRGDETEPLDEATVEGFLESMRGRIDSVAIAGYLSVRNPEHEDRVRGMVERILGILAVCGHDLSSDLLAYAAQIRRISLGTQR